jgi:hypothetical protein
LPLALHLRHQQLLQLRPAARVTRQETHDHAVATGLRQLERSHRTQQAVGHLHGDARAVARSRISAFAAAMLQVTERRQRALDGLMSGHAAEARDQRHATTIVLVFLVVKASAERIQEETPCGERVRSRASACPALVSTK